MSSHNKKVTGSHPSSNLSEWSSCTCFIQELLFFTDQVILLALNCHLVWENEKLSHLSQCVPEGLVTGCLLPFTQWLQIGTSCATNVSKGRWKKDIYIYWEQTVFCFMFSIKLQIKWICLYSYFILIAVSLGLCNRNTV